jgi:WD40 repeat protein
MSDAFISYSREDGRAFVDRLHRALRAQGKDVWVDRRIPGGAEWEAEIHENIRRSDAFVFVISPGAFNPQGYCLRELDHAIELGKRILPLQYRPVDAESLPEAIKTHNWIPSEGGFEDSFDEHLGKLIEAIETDLDWVRGHTHWGDKAEEWAENDRDRSFLLRGAELRDAEQWLSNQEGKEPPPTPRHSEYVLGSRAGATRRQRVLVGSVSIGLVVAVALAIFAFVQRNHATQERRAAVSRALAANAFLQLKSDPELSLLFAIRAAEAAPTQEAVDALKEGLIESRVLMTLRGHEGSVNGAILSPDGHLILTWGDDGTARLWSARNGEPLHVMHGEQLHTVQGGRAAILDASFSDDGRRVLTVAQGTGTARVWDARTGKQTAIIRVPPPHPHAEVLDARFAPGGRLVVTSSFFSATRIWRSSDGSLVRKFPPAAPVAFSPNGSLLLTGDPRPTLWDVRSGGRVESFHQDPKYSADIEFSPDGRLFVSAGGPGSHGVPTTVREVAGGRLVARWRQGRPVRDVVFSPHGKEIAILSEHGTAQLRSTNTGHLVADLTGQAGTVNSVAFSPHGRLLATGGDDGIARIWDLRGNAVATLAGHRAPINSVAFEPGRSSPKVVTASADGTVRVWDASTSGPAFYLRAARSVGETAVLSDDGGMLASKEHGAVVIRDSATGDVRSRTPAHGQSPAAVTNDGRLVATAPSFPGFFHEVVRILQAGASGAAPTVRDAPSVASAAFSPDGRELAIGGTSKDVRHGFAAVWDANTGRRIATDHGLSGGEVLGIRFSPNGDSVATSASDGLIRLWDLGSNAITTTIHAFPPNSQNSPTSSVAFNPNGSLVAGVANWEPFGGIWDTASGEQVARLGGGITSARFSPDGDFVITGGDDGSARIWDPATGESLAVLPDAVGGFGAEAAFVRSGNAIATVGPGPPFFEPARLKIFSCDSCRPLDQLLAVARERVTRSLTPAETARYLGGVD